METQTPFTPQQSSVQIFSNPRNSQAETSPQQENLEQFKALLVQGWRDNLNAVAAE